MSRKVAVVNTEATATRMRETFHDSKARKRVALAFGWPKRFTFIGKGEGVIYWSDKWKTTDTYKHKKEGREWDVYAADTLDLGGECAEGPSFKVQGVMPKHVAYIGKFIGLQFVSVDGHPVHMELRKSHWAAIEIPSTGETVLLAYDNEGVQLLITGDSIAIEKDGIVG